MRKLTLDELLVNEGIKHGDIWLKQFVDGGRRDCIAHGHGAVMVSLSLPAWSSESPQCWLYEKEVDGARVSAGRGKRYWWIKAYFPELSEHEDFDDSPYRPQ